MEWWGWVMLGVLAAVVVLAAVLSVRWRRASGSDSADVAPTGQLWPRFGQGRQR